LNIRRPSQFDDANRTPLGDAAGTEIRWAADDQHPQRLISPLAWLAEDGAEGAPIVGMIAALFRS
jgi:hypothetical protein